MLHIDFFLFLQFFLDKQIGIQLQVLVFIDLKNVHFIRFQEIIDLVQPVCIQRSASKEVEHFLIFQNILFLFRQQKQLI